MRLGPKEWPAVRKVRGSMGEPLQRQMNSPAES